MGRCGCDYDTTHGKHELEECVVHSIVVSGTFQQAGLRLEVLDPSGALRYLYQVHVSMTLYLYEYPTVSRSTPQVDENLGGWAPQQSSC